MENNEIKSEFFDLNVKAMEYDGFWIDIHKENIIFNIESTYHSHILKEWCIDDLVNNGNDKFLIKWVKRYHPLTDEVINQKYGR